MHSHTVLTAVDVRRIARHARTADLNRLISENTLKDLDPDGFSIMAMMLPFHNIDHGGPAHHRVQVFLKMRGTMEPCEGFADVLVTDWDKLPEMTETTS